MAQEPKASKVDVPKAPKIKAPVRRGGPAKALAALTERMTRPLFRRRGFADSTIITEWPRIAGDAIAAHSCPEKISFQPGKRHGGTLHLTVAPGGFAVELQHLEHQLIERINGFFGYGAVARLHLVQAPLPSPPPKPAPEPVLSADESAAVSTMVADVEDDELRQRLESLGKGIQRREKARKT